VLASGMPFTSGGVQLNRFCASGLEAVNTAAQKVRSGWDDLVLAGGVESMSRCRWDPTRRHGAGTRHQLRRHVRPAGHRCRPDRHIEGFSRDDVDNYALRSQERPPRPWSGGYFEKSVVPVRDQNGLLILDHDEAHAARHHQGGPGQAEVGLRGPRGDGRLRRRGAAEVPLGGEDQPRAHRRETAPELSTARRWSWSANEAAGQSQG